MSGADATAHVRSQVSEPERAWNAARSAYQSGDLMEARRLALAIVGKSRAAGDDRCSGRAQLLLADIARAAGDAESTAAALRQALASFTLLSDDAEAAEVLTDLATLNGEHGRFAEAVDLARQAVARSRGGIRALTVLGYAQWLAGSPADALAHFDQALSQSHEAPAALAGRGQVRADLGEYEQALADLDRALNDGVSDEANLRSARALALAGLNRKAEAESELAIALALDPERTPTLLRQVRIRLLAGVPDPGRAVLERIAAAPHLAPVDRSAARRLLTRA